MSNKDQKPEKSGFSLQDEIKKRKTQEIQRAVETKRATGTGPLVSPDTKRTSQTTNAAPSANDPRRTSQTMPPARPAADPRRSTQTGPLISPDTKRTSQSMTAVKRSNVTIPAQLADHSRRNLLIAGFATVLAVLVLGGSYLLARNSMTPVTPTSTPSLPLAMVSADDVIAYLKKVSVPILELRPLPVDGTVWAASQEIQFDVQRGVNKVTFIILSYPSMDQASGDLFRAKSNTKFKDWQITSISNVLFLSSPNAAPDIKAEMASHLSSYLLAPYRPFLPTATPLPSATSLPTTPAATAQGTP